MLKVLKLVVLAIALAVATLILLQNSMGVTIVWLSQSLLTLPLGMVLVGAAMGGILTGLMLQWLLPLGMATAIPLEQPAQKRNSQVKPNLSRDEWDIENPPVRPTQVNSPPPRDRPREANPTPPPRPTSSPRKKPQSNKNQVYDANYRVINPPENSASSSPEPIANSSNPSNQEEDQDWV